MSSPGCSRTPKPSHARTTARAMDAPSSVTPAEERALAEIAQELGVEEGESWAALVRELEATQSSA